MYRLPRRGGAFGGGHSSIVAAVTFPVDAGFCCGARLPPRIIMCFPGVRGFLESWDRDGNERCLPGGWFLRGRCMSLHRYVFAPRIDSARVRVNRRHPSCGSDSILNLVVCGEKPREVRQCTLGLEGFAFL